MSPELYLLLGAPAGIVALIIGTKAVINEVNENGDPGIEHLGLLFMVVFAAGVAAIGWPATIVAGLLWLVVAQKTKEQN